MIIRAEHKWWAGRLFYPYLDRIFRKDYSHFYVTNTLPEIPKDSGLLLTPNHISWWDGFFIVYLMRRMTKRRIYLMMLKEQLARFAFFRFLGAYSIDPGHRKSVIESLEYTAEILQQNDSFAVVYPQGEIVPQRSAPLEFREGLLFSLTKVTAPVHCMPVTFLVKPYNERHPELWCRFGPAVPAEKGRNHFKGDEKLCNNEVLELEGMVLARNFEEDLFVRKGKLK